MTWMDLLKEESLTKRLLMMVKRIYLVTYFLGTCTRFVTLSLNAEKNLINLKVKEDEDFSRKIHPNS